MVEMTRMNLRVPDDIPALLASLAGSKNKMGDYMAAVIRQIHSGQMEAGKPGELEMMAGSLMHLSAKVKELEARLTQIESKVG